MKRSVNWQVERSDNLQEVEGMNHLCSYNRQFLSSPKKLFPSIYTHSTWFYSLQRIFHNRGCCWKLSLQMILCIYWIKSYSIILLTPQSFSPIAMTILVPAGKQLQSFTISECNYSTSILQKLSISFICENCHFEQCSSYSILPIPLNSWSINNRDLPGAAANSTWRETESKWSMTTLVWSGP